MILLTLWMNGKCWADRRLWQLALVTFLPLDCAAATAILFDFLLVEYQAGDSIGRREAFPFIVPLWLLFHVISSSCLMVVHPLLGHVARIWGHKQASGGLQYCFSPGNPNTGNSSLKNVVGDNEKAGRSNLFILFFILQKQHKKRLLRHGWPRGSHFAVYLKFLLEYGDGNAFRTWGKCVAWDALLDLCGRCGRQGTFFNFLLLLFVLHIPPQPPKLAGCGISHRKGIHVIPLTLFSNNFTVTPSPVTGTYYFICSP